MNREIKFRAWFELEKVMVTQDRLSMSYDRNEGLTKAFDDWSSDEEGTLSFKLMQYTGLKDRNGKEIYEGDIIFTDEADYLDQVVFENGAFYIRTLSNRQFEDELLSESTVEVRGNIFENPELRK